MSSSLYGTVQEPLDYCVQQIVRVSSKAIGPTCCRVLAQR